METKKLALLRVGEICLLNRYPSEVNKKGQLEYFIYGEGWKKTKKFKIIEGIEMPDVWSELSWLQIAKYFDQYGIEVANQYAERKTAGIVSRQTARGYGFIYQKIKDLITDDFNPEFFEMLRCDYMLSCFGMFTFDIVALDQALIKKHGQYDKEQNKSMKQFISETYGDLYVRILERLIENVVLN